jgi:hypothetical protein
LAATIALFTALVSGARPSPRAPYARTSYKPLIPSPGGLTVAQLAQRIAANIVTIKQRIEWTIIQLRQEVLLSSIETPEPRAASYRGYTHNNKYACKQMIIDISFLEFECPFAYMEMRCCHQLPRGLAAAIEWRIVFRTK